MAIFSKKTEKKSVVVKKTPAPKKETSVSSKEIKINSNSYRIIKNPRITEKAARISGEKVYTFDVGRNAGKTDIAKAIVEIYKVKPRKITVASIPTKKVFRKGTSGVKGGGKKAYVYLKKGDTIEFV